MKKKKHKKKTKQIKNFLKKELKTTQHFQINLSPLAHNTLIEQAQLETKIETITSILGFIKAIK